MGAKKSLNPCPSWPLDSAAAPISLAKFHRQKAQTPSPNFAKLRLWAPMGAIKRSPGGGSLLPHVPPRAQQHQTAPPINLNFTFIVRQCCLALPAKVSLLRRRVSFANVTFSFSLLLNPLKRYPSGRPWQLL